jgi:glycosyltransferase involved in cell wall biosynthesis
MIRLAGDTKMRVRTLDGRLTVSTPHSTKVLIEGQDMFLEGPGVFWCQPDSQFVDSYQIDGVERISFLRSMVTRFFPIGGSHHTYRQVWANSNFTREWIMKWWKVDSMVVYPPVEGKPKKDPNIENKQIVSVGRFMSTKNHHSKNQHKLVKALKMLNRSAGGYSLKLVGGVSKTEQHYFNRVKKISTNLPIELLPNAGGNELKESITTSTFYWHAAGMGQPSSKPQNFEHFGIAPIEAMSSGLIPFVYKKGGPAEVLADFPELIYGTLRELVSKTESFEEDQILTMSEKMINLSKKFDTKSFALRIESLIEGLI